MKLLTFSCDILYKFLFLFMEPRYLLESRIKHSPGHKTHASGTELVFVVDWTEAIIFLEVVRRIFFHSVYEETETRGEQNPVFMRNWVQNN